MAGVLRQPHHPTLTRETTPMPERPDRFTATLYATPNDVPVPLRQKLVELRRKGMTIRDIARFFTMPEHWVVLFVETPHGLVEN